MEMIVRASRKCYHIEEVEFYIVLSWFMVEMDELCLCMCCCVGLDPNHKQNLNIYIFI